MSKETKPEITRQQLGKMPTLAGNRLIDYCATRLEQPTDSNIVLFITKLSNADICRIFGLKNDF